MRTTLQALGLTLVLSPVIYLYLVAEAFAIARLGHGFTYAQLGLILLKVRLGIPILLLVLACLTFWNFKWSQPDWKLWRRNLIAVLTAFVAVSLLSHAVYFRAWELLVPIEPPHGQARLSPLNPPKLQFDPNTIIALLPDRRLAVEQIRQGNYGRIFPILNSWKFVGGSNWVDAASDYYRIAAIQSDGSFWSCQIHPEHAAYPLTRIGADTNWLHVSGRLGFLLLKNDHSLWCWGVALHYPDEDNLRTYLAMSPTRLGQETNWREIVSPGSSLARRDDGSIWALEFGRGHTNLEPHLRPLESWNRFNKGFFTLAGTYTSMGDWTEGVKTNGELWLFADLAYQKTKELQLGKNSKWKTSAFANDGSILAIRVDGTLWKWPPPGRWVRNPDSVKPVQVGTYSGWIALYPYVYGGCIALAADGNLWAWKDPSEHLWLAPSRKPIFIGNIFGNSD